MQAVQLDAVGRKLAQRDLADPVARPGEVLVAIEAAGVCHSDAHYRAGHPQAGPLPLTLGHEVAGTIVAAGDGGDRSRIGQRVALHYLVGCGACAHCRAGDDRLCAEVEMIGKERPGGFAELIVVPAANALAVPDEVSAEAAAVMMCSGATAWHALRRARVQAGETVSIVGVGGLGNAAAQLAPAAGAGRVTAVDIDPDKLDAVAGHGVDPVLAEDPSDPLAGVTGDVVIDFTGSSTVLSSAVAHRSSGRRIVVVGIVRSTLHIRPYEDILVGERELIGSSDHTVTELEELLQLAAAGAFRPERSITRRIPLDAGAIDATLDDLEQGGAAVRTVVTI